MKNPEVGNIVALKSVHPIFGLAKGTLGVVTSVLDDDPVDVTVEFTQYEKSATFCSREVKFIARGGEIKPVYKLNLTDEIILVTAKGKNIKAMVTSLSLGDLEEEKINIVVQDHKENVWDLDVSYDEEIMVLDYES